MEGLLQFVNWKPGRLPSRHRALCAAGGVGPLPVDDFRFVDSILVGVGAGIQLLIAEPFLGVRP